MRSSLTQFVESGAGDVAGYRFEENPTRITSHETFWRTVEHYAALHMIDAGHLGDTLRMTLHPGEAVTAQQIWRTAAALARGGFARAEEVGTSRQERKAG
jgi:hypothetical protein